MTRKSVPPPDETDDAKAEYFPMSFDATKGRILFQRIPAWLMSPRYYVALQKQLEAVMGKAAKGILYRAAEESGAWFAKLVGGDLAADADDMARVGVLLRIAEMMPIMGHGRATLVVEDLGSLRTTWTLPFSLIAELRKPAAEPVCHFYAGAAAGVVQQIFGRPVSCEEVACVAKGDPACLIRTAAAETGRGGGKRA